MSDAATVHLASNVTYLRESMDLHRETLAGYLGVTASHLANLEKGRTRSPGFFLIESLARFFGVTCEQLVRADLVEEVGRETTGVRDRALSRIGDNFDTSELGCILALVDGITRQQAREGRFRESTHRQALSRSEP